MSLAGLLTILDDDPQLHDVISCAESDTTLAVEPSAATLAGEDLVAPPTLRPVLTAALTRRAGGAGRFVLAVTATAREAEDLTTALGSFLPAGRVASFPGWETLPHERLSPQSDTVGRRIAVLRRLAHPGAAGQPDGPLSVVVAPVRSLLQPIVAGLGDLAPVSLREGDTCELDDLLTRLVEIGYARADLVGARGEIAVRGGIVDVFPPTEEHPLRVEFFGDTVEEIRYFKVADQRSIGRADNGLWAPPCRELLLTPAVRDRAKELAAAHPALADMLGKVAEGISVEGMEAFTPVLADRMDLLVDYLPPGGIVLACDPERIRARADDLVRTSQEFLEASWATAASGGEAPIDLGSSAFQPIARIRAAAAALGLPWWTIAPFGVSDEPEPGTDAHPGLHGTEAGPTDRVPFRINASLSPAYRGDAARMLTDVRTWLAQDWRVILVTEGHGPAQRLAETLRGEGIGARLQDLDQAPEPGVPYVTTACVENGFVWPAVKLALITESDLAGHPGGLPTTRDMRRMPSRRRGGVDPLQLQAGDYVVHEQHGVGRYVEMTSRTAAGATREYLVIEYAPGRRGQPPDRLYVPTDQLDEVTKYSGGEAPTLHRLGGADWAKAKGRARKAVRQIAAELIRLYSARMASPGFAFGPDTPWQGEHELEQIMVDFWERKYDVLVSTTIIESGLDIPNSNTLIIDRADMYGLSQLHQLRGRVGRGTERAYAYFLYPPEAALTETAHERLATVAQHTEIGVGMYVALKDLEIRGAGNLLGGEQSGHIAGVGFDLYVRMIGEAVSELKGDGPAEKPEVRVELPVNAHIPHEYVAGERLRLEAYTRIAAIDSEADVAAALAELTDRYGAPPEPVLNLLEVARLRVAARRAGLTDITAAGNHIRFTPVELPDSRQVRVQRLYPKTILKSAVRTMLVPAPKTAVIGGQPLRDTELLTWCSEVIRSVLADL